MLKDASAARSERRHLRRRRVLLGGVICDAYGETAIDCTIRGLSAGGAQVQLAETLQLDKEIYLVDTWKDWAYLAKVAWIKADRAGLSFVRSYGLSPEPPAPLQFLKSVLLDAKLRQVRALVERGRSPEEATRMVGLKHKGIAR